MVASRHVAFDEVYAAEYPGLVRLAVGLVDDRARAEELVQDCFIAALPKWGRLENPAAYLRRALVNKAHSELRRRRVARRWAPPVEPAVELSLRDRELLDALNRVSPRRRIVLVLRYLEDYSEADVAEILGCRPGTVKSLASRGLADLREVVSR